MAENGDQFPARGTTPLRGLPPLPLSVTSDEDENDDDFGLNAGIRGINDNVQDHVDIANENNEAMLNSPGNVDPNQQVDVTAINQAALFQESNDAKYKRLLNQRTVRKTHLTKKTISPVENILMNPLEERREYHRINFFLDHVRILNAEWTIIGRLDEEMGNLITESRKMANHLDLVDKYNERLTSVANDIDYELVELFLKFPEHPRAPPRQSEVPPVNQINISPPDVQVVQKRTATVKLPQFALPTFSGQTAEYLSFINHFDAAILKNTALQPSEKLLYLQSACQGDAKILISKLLLTDSNLRVALDLLEERYGTKSEIRKVHYEALFAAPKTRENDSQSFRKLLQIFSTNLDGLIQCGVVWKSWKPLLMFMMVKCLDNDTRKHWELKYEDTEQTYDVLRVFLTKRAIALECAGHIKSHLHGNDNPHKGKKEERKKEHKSSVPQTTANVATTGGAPPNYQGAKSYNIPPCVKCAQVHHLYYCKDFEKMTVKDRWALVRDRKLCWNCMQSGHGKDKCGSKHVCKLCKDKHHSMLHVAKNADDKGGKGNGK